MTPNDRAAYIRALVAHRCPELTDADIASTEALAQPADSASTEAVLPIEIADLVIDAITALEDKVDWLAERVGVDDDDATRRRAGA